MTLKVLGSKLSAHHLSLHKLDTTSGVGIVYFSLACIDACFLIVHNDECMFLTNGYNGHLNGQFTLECGGWGENLRPMLGRGVSEKH